MVEDARHVALSPPSGRFIDGEHHFALRVYFEDTDAGGVVYHANYLRFMERARSDMLRLVGIDQRATMEAGRGVYAVVRADVTYRAPARLDDALLVRSRVADVRAATCIIDHDIMRSADLIAQAQVTVAFVAPTGRPTRQPPAWVALFQSISTRENPVP